jgi:hypothetical protein
MAVRQLHLLVTYPDSTFAAGSSKCLHRFTKGMVCNFGKVRFASYRTWYQVLHPHKTGKETIGV